MSLLKKVPAQENEETEPGARNLAREEAKRRRQMAADLRRDTGAFKRIIVEKLVQMDVCYREPKRKGSGGRVERVRFCESCASPEAIYLRIDTRRLPRGVKTAVLADSEVLNDLSYACQRVVHVRSTVRGGFWYVVDREEGVHGIPRLVRYEDMLTMIPSTAGRLVVPIGAGENQRLKYADLTDMTHVLIGGATGAGKSVWVNSMLCTLIQRNEPANLRMIMVDLKGGVELGFYKGLPHLLQPIVTRRANVVDALQVLRDEVERRLNLFEGVCRDIRGWNYQHRTDGQRLPYWLLVIDELANVMLDKSLKSDAEPLLADVAARGRAPGVHVVVATQRPSVDVVTGLIKANFPTRLAFSCADMASSRTIIDTGDAYALAPEGRAVFYMGARKQELQGPLITDRQVTEIVRLVLHGDVEPASVPTHDVTRQEVLEYALENLKGRLPEKELFRVFGPRGLTLGELRLWLRDTQAAGTTQVLGQRYEVRPGVGRAARRLVPVGQTVPVEDEQEQGQEPEPESPSEDAWSGSVGEWIDLEGGNDGEHVDEQD